MNVFRFLRDEDEKDLSWDDQVAKKYYSSLFREYAVCDLKHYKSGNVCSNQFDLESLLSLLYSSHCDGGQRLKSFPGQDKTPAVTHDASITNLPELSPSHL